MPGLKFMRGRGAYNFAPTPTASADILGAVLIGVNDEGWRDAAVGALYGSSGGTFSGSTTVRGETVNGIFWDSPDMYVFITGAGKASWFTGQLIRINGTAYSFTGSFDFSTFTVGTYSTTQLFFAGNNYTIAWT